MEMGGGAAARRQDPLGSPGAGREGAVGPVLRHGARHPARAGRHLEDLPFDLAEALRASLGVALLVGLRNAQPKGDSR
jgi:hypothetical protein